jgi:hypothetical protein
MNFSRELAGLNITVWVVVCPVFVFASTQDFFSCQFLWWDVILRGLRGIFQTEKSSHTPISMKGADYAPLPPPKISTLLDFWTFHHHNNLSKSKLCISALIF